MDIHGCKGRDLQEVRDLSLLVTRDNAEEIVAETRSYSEIVRKIFRLYAKKQKMSRVGDKSAFFNHQSLSVLKRILPESKFLHVIRDGRDVWLSWSEIWTAPSSMVHAAVVWKEHIQENRKWG